jgi:hypothetical protein
MHRIPYWILVLLLFSVGPATAQTPPQTPTTDPTAAPPTVEFTVQTDSPAARFWVRAEYLAWWVKSSPVPVPIVTTGDPTVGFDPTGAATVNTAGRVCPSQFFPG